MSSPAILTLDLETFPAVVETFQTYKAYISPDQIREPGKVAMFAAKWHDSKLIHDYSLHNDGQEKLAKWAQAMLDTADIVVTYNGKRFDVPHLQRTILEAGLRPPAPFKQVDLYQVVRHNFRFESNKLAYVVKQLGLGAKMQTGGYELWQRCMADDPKAWRKMIRYCRQDVAITDRLYDRLLPWISAHPHVGAWSSATDEMCPSCGSTNLQWRGQQVAAVNTYRRFQCQACGKWGRSTAMLSRAEGTRAA